MRRCQGLADSVVSTGRDSVLMSSARHHACHCVGHKQGTRAPDPASAPARYQGLALAAPPNLLSVPLRCQGLALMLAAALHPGAAPLRCQRLALMLAAALPGTRERVERQ